ncbi:hypothetical protein LCGC14_0163780 [marine sediment metagenome]|uniref:Uncharacterized protein n=1 Tax=marine sediment metagenome TaxID=412755 RepID=A0A0F9UYD4_9ZZZZ
MIQRPVHLLCDHCGRQFSDFGGLQQPNFGAAQLRAEAKHHGWEYRMARTHEYKWTFVDVCDTCVALEFARPQDPQP